MNAAAKAEGVDVTVGLIGVPTDVGASDRGACMGPQALRIMGLNEDLSGLGHRVKDHGDLSGPANPQRAPRRGLRHLREVNAWCGLLRDKVGELLGVGEVPLILGGDHSISIGSVSGVAAHCAGLDKPLSVIWLDAHADFNTPASSPSGNIHGMPLAALCGQIELDEIDIGPGRPVLDPTNVHLVGIRSVDATEKSMIMDCGVNVYDMRTVDERGMVAIMREILEAVTGVGGHLHVSFDGDFLDPPIAPGVGTTVAGGATFREAHLCMELIHESGLLGSLDLVELNPMLDVHGQTAAMMVDLTGSAFGKKIVYRPGQPRAH